MSSSHFIVCDLIVDVFYSLKCIEQRDLISLTSDDIEEKLGKSGEISKLKKEEIHEMMKIYEGEKIRKEKK